MKILFVTCNGVEDAAFGGAKASIRNYELLRQSGEVEVYHIRHKSALRSLLSGLQGNFPPADNGDIRVVLEKLEEGVRRGGPWDMVFFDGSHFGNMVRAVKRRGVKTVVFFHNCEYDYIDVRFGKKKSLKKTVYKHLIEKQEGRAARLADKRIAFTPRDADRIKELYGPEDTEVIPLSLKDIFPGAEFYQGQATQPAPPEQLASPGELAAPGGTTPPWSAACLLFGPLGQANEEGFGWFVEKVSPGLSCRTLVAGKGFEAYRERWGSGKVEVVGTVENVAELYGRASCVAIPLLSGGGMKIKTAEALMFGKTVFGTGEAFAGYEEELPRAGVLCNTAEDFVREINGFLAGGGKAYNPEARRLYEERYSLEASGREFKRVIEELCP